MHDADSLQELVKPQVEAIVEVPDNCSVRQISVSRSIEVEYLFPRFVPGPLIATPILT